MIGLEKTSKQTPFPCSEDNSTRWIAHRITILLTITPPISRTHRRRRAMHLASHRPPLRSTQCIFRSQTLFTRTETHFCRAQADGAAWDCRQEHGLLHQVRNPHVTWTRREMCGRAAARIGLPACDMRQAPSSEAAAARHAATWDNFSLHVPTAARNGADSSGTCAVGGCELAAAR